MEYAEGGDLQKKISAAQKQKALIPEFKIWKMLFQMLSGMSEGGVEDFGSFEDPARYDNPAPGPEVCECVHSEWRI